MANLKTRIRRCRGDERGVTLVTFALSLVAMCAVIALILGGSVGYTAERDSQTASDTAALAATSKLRQFQTGAATASEVATTAQTIAEANDADGGSQVICEIVNADYATTGSDSDVIGPCSETSNVSDPDAAGVRLRTAETRDVPFGEVAGLETIESNTLAAATIQPLATGNSPFMLCSPAPGHPAPVLDGSDEIDPAAIGNEYVLQGTMMKDDGRDCGNPAANWRGWVDFDSTFSVPGWWGVESGNKNGHIDKQLVGPDACGGQGTEVDDFNGCVLAVPLCTTGKPAPGNNYEVYCVTFGSFEITHNGSGPSSCYSGNPQHICGRFLGAAVAAGGQGGSGQAGVNDVVLIKLVQ